MLFDNHQRPITYLRLAVTDRCNLRCFYCMPEDGIRYIPRKELLTFEEITRMVRVMAGMGIKKLRLTGGEPFLRTDLMELIRMLTRIDGIEEVHLTTNGLLTTPHIPELKSIGIKSVNLSLDTLDRERFRIITRRDKFQATWQTLQLLVRAGIPVKINAVVMEGKNIDDIIPMVELTRHNDISVRFIEEMPFNGDGDHFSGHNWNHKRILEHIRAAFPSLTKVPDAPHATAMSYQVDGHKGTVGVIAAFSRTFCGTCNRIRVTAQGTLKTCLYDDGVLDLKGIMRSGASDDEMRHALLKAFGSRPKDGFEAEAARKQLVSESMSTIGG